MDADYHKRGGYHRNRADDAKNKVHRAALCVCVCGVEAQEVEYLHCGKEYHAGQALLLWQKHEKEICPQRAKKPELCENIIVCFLPENKAENTRRCDVNIGEDGKHSANVVHKKGENYFKQYKVYGE